VELEAKNILSENSKIIKFIDDVKEALIKAIGTSSSVDQERDERSVENYVRESANTHVNNEPGDYTIGGNKMSNNTTEPDPKGDIAVQKDLPNAVQPASADLVDQTTRPYGDVTVSEAPNNDASADVSTGGAGVYKAGMVCPDCNEAIAHKCAMDKADETKEEDKVEKADVCADCGKSTADCGCTKKAVDEESKEKAADDEKAEMKKSLGSPIWKGAFVPFNN
jgi:hypothetical protein